MKLRIHTRLRRSGAFEQQGQRRQQAALDHLESLADRGVLEGFVPHIWKARRAGLTARKEPPVTGTPALLLSLLMLAGFALAAGGVYTLIKLEDRKKGILMLIAALVMWGNVAIMIL